MPKIWAPPLDSGENFGLNVDQVPRDPAQKDMDPCSKWVKSGRPLRRLREDHDSCGVLYHLDGPFAGMVIDFWMLKSNRTPYSVQKVRSTQVTLSRDASNGPAIRMDHGDSEALEMDGAQSCHISTHTSLSARDGRN